VLDDDAALIEIVRRPIGVIAAIKPWNVPIGMAVNTIAPAFRAGCTVVLKPSPFTPVVTAAMGEILRDVVPDRPRGHRAGQRHQLRARRVGVVG
jgi:acyl-CoA reductase-like NAD-dependent aldehyde dehydrogenase